MFVMFVGQRDECQDGCPQPVLGNWSFLSFARCPVAWRGGTGVLVGGIILSSAMNLKSSNTGEGNHATGANCLWVRS